MLHPPGLDRVLPQERPEYICFGDVCDCKRALPHLLASRKYICNMLQQEAVLELATTACPVRLSSDVIIAATKEMMAVHSVHASAVTGRAEEEERRSSS